MCAVSAIVGVLLFGDRTAPAFGGYLNAWTELQDLPELTLYSMLWWPLVMLIWQFMALWWQVPVVPYLGFGNELANVLMLTRKTLTCSLCNTVEPILCCMSKCALVEWSSHGLHPPGMRFKHETLCAVQLLQWLALRWFTLDGGTSTGVYTLLKIQWLLVVWVLCTSHGQLSR